MLTAVNNAGPHVGDHLLLIAPAAQADTLASIAMAEPGNIKGIVYLGDAQQVSTSASALPHYLVGAKSAKHTHETDVAGVTNFIVHEDGALPRTADLVRVVDTVAIKNYIAPAPVLAATPASLSGGTATLSAVADLK